MVCLICHAQTAHPKSAGCLSAGACAIVLPLPRRMSIRSRPRLAGAASALPGAGRRPEERIPLASQAGDPTPFLSAVCGFEKPVTRALRHHDEIFLAIPKQGVCLGASTVLPFVDFRVRCRIFDDPADPSDTLASAQVRRSVLLRVAFLHEMPECGPSPRRFRHAATSDRQAAKPKAAAGYLLTENAIQGGFPGRPVAAESFQREEGRRRVAAVPYGRHIETSNLASCGANGPVGVPCANRSRNRATMAALPALSPEPRFA